MIIKSPAPSRMFIRKHNYSGNRETEKKYKLLLYKVTSQEFSLTLVRIIMAG